jgi:hypothetical protein
MTKRKILSPLAAVTLGILLWLFDLMQQPGTDVLASLGAGAAAYVTVLLIVAAARAEDRS